jgi:ketosteroid isomerase-like protein
LHEAQNAFYAGGDSAALERLLEPAVTWTVPGESSIAGIYRGIDEVRAYLRRRRELASETFRLIRRDVLVGDGSQIAALTDGVATIRGMERSWSTVGLYEVGGGRVASCRLIPFDQAQFDAIWSGDAT